MEMNFEIEYVKAMADPTRLRLLSLLTMGELCICDLTEALRQPQSTVSRHMSRLYRAGLVAVEQRGKWRHYRLSDSATIHWKHLRTFIEGLTPLEPYRTDHTRLRQLIAANGKTEHSSCTKPIIEG